MKATITVNTITRKEANEIIQEISNSDMSATFSNDMDTVTTSELRATILDNNNVVISSDEICEAQLKSMFL